MRLHYDALFHGSETQLIISVEGPSAVGKTSLVGQLEESMGAAVVAELSDAPPSDAEALEWFVAAHSDQLSHARELERTAAFVVIDGEPFKGFWWSWIYGDELELETVLNLHRQAVCVRHVVFPGSLCPPSRNRGAASGPSRKGSGSPPTELRAAPSPRAAPDALLSSYAAA